MLVAHNEHALSAETLPLPTLIGAAHMRYVGVKRLAHWAWVTFYLFLLLCKAKEAMLVIIHGLL